jgi:FlaA1/EpsC-like NDP-sugar epimerase
MDDVLQLIGRRRPLFVQDLQKHEERLQELTRGARFLVIGGAGSIGQAVVKEIFRRDPAALHVVDLSENNLVELVRDIRSTLGYIAGDFRTLPLDCRSVEYDSFIRHQAPYDYILNFSALKHVRSEKDPFTLMRLIDANIFNVEATARQAVGDGSRKYFCVSTDKATNPVNMMGASKRIMELFLMRASHRVPVSTARFANVAFSDGSLLHGFNLRLQKRQPLSAPSDVRRYFLTAEESGQLCLMACLLGGNRDIFFPKLDEKEHLVTFAEIARRYLARLGYEAVACRSEEEARARVAELAAQKKWPCWFFTSDTSGEKDFEEFYTAEQALDLERFADIGVIANEAVFDGAKLDAFAQRIQEMKAAGDWSKQELVALFEWMLPEFRHKETHKYLDQRM